MKITAEISSQGMLMKIEDPYIGVEIERHWKATGPGMKMSDGENHIDEVYDNDDYVKALEAVERALVDLMDVID